MAGDDGVEPPYHGSKPCTQTVVLIPYIKTILSNHLKKFHLNHLNNEIRDDN